MNERTQPSTETATAAHSVMPSALRQFVVAAREQPLITTNVTAEAVAAGLELERGRGHGRRVVWLSAAVAVAASLAVLGLVWPLLSTRVVDLDPTPDSVGPQAMLTVEPTRSLAPNTIAEQPTLANGVRIRSTSPVDVRGPWSIGMSEGSHEIEMDPQAGRTLSIALPTNRTLELVEGHLSVGFVDSEPVVRLHTGVAAWVDEQGERVQIRVEHVELAVEDGSKSTLEPTATQLARTAEQQLEAGDRSAAIATYRTLIRKYPRTSQSRAAMLDLGRLFRADHRDAEARCAYQLYLERWPDSAVRAEVESQLDRLGPGPTCRGLTPT